MKRKASFRNLPKLSRPLSQDEMVAFREDLREADKEVQGYFRIYYIVGLIGVAAWLISPETKPLLELTFGNGGYNIYAPLAITFLNSVSTTYLLYKSIEIHEIAQFISYGSPPDSGFIGWEEWRRSMVSATRWPRKLYTPFLTLVPMAVSLSLLYASWRTLHTPVEQLASAVSILTPTIPQGVVATSEPGPQYSPAQIRNIQNVFSTARIFLYIIVCLHLIPVILIYFNLFRVPLLWSVVQSTMKRNTEED